MGRGYRISPRHLGPPRLRRGEGWKTPRLGGGGLPTKVELKPNVQKQRGWGEPPPYQVHARTCRAVAKKPGLE